MYLNILMAPPKYLVAYLWSLSQVEYAWLVAGRANKTPGLLARWDQW
jgi:hypothetical protein